MGDRATISARGLTQKCGRWLGRFAMFAGTVALALVISGAIFQIIPGVTIAHSRGPSMLPNFRDGDVVLLRIESPRKVSKGDVVLFHEGNIPVTHRVIEVGEADGANTVIVTQGDNNPVPDDPIRLGDVQGRVMTTIPFLGSISRSLGAGGGFYVYHYAGLLICLTFVLAYVAVSVSKLNEESKRRYLGS